MHHEGTSKSAPWERYEEKQEQVELLFALDRMEPRQITALASALGSAINVASELSPNSPISHELPPQARAYLELRNRLDDSLKGIARMSDDALPVYLELAMGDLSTDASRSSAIEMVPDLLRQNLDVPKMKQQIIDSLVAMLQADDLVDSNGTRIISANLAKSRAYMMVFRLQGVDWLDDSIKHYLYDQLPKPA